MNILHVSQGLPPFRTGGLTQYCYDLMTQQRENGHQVSLLYPGPFRPGSMAIRPVRRLNQGFDLFSIVNPLPLALIFGINAPARYMSSGDMAIYEAFLSKYHFDVIHIHCIMGIHKEFFQAAAKLKIPMILTTHDYYVFCLKTSLMNETGEICHTPSPEKCHQCNLGKGLSRKSEILMQSELYSRLKYSRIMSAVRSYNRNKIENDVSLKKSYPASTVSSVEYGNLLEYYRNICGLIDVFHCNSESTKQIYQTFLPHSRFTVIPITSGNVALAPSNHIKRKNSTLHIGFLGGGRKEKGLSKLLESLSVLDFRGFKGWKLDIYGGGVVLPKQDLRIHVLGKYKPEQLKKIFSTLDVIVVPSVWCETFGLVTAEALSYGLPVVASNLVGAQSLLKDGPQTLIYDALSANSLADSLMPLFKIDLYNKVARWVYEVCSVDNLESHSRKIEQLYAEVRTNNTHRHLCR